MFPFDSTFKHSMHPSSSPGGGGVELPAKFSKRGILTGPQLLEGGDFFQMGGGGVQFSHKK